MNLKTISIVVGSLALIALLLSQTRTTPQWESDDPFVGQSLLATEKARTIRALEIQSNEDEAIRIQLSDTGRWVLPESHNTPVNFDRLNSLVSSLAEANIARKVTERPDRMERLDLERFALRLLGEGDTVLTSLQIGKSGSSGGSFVKLDESAAAYLTSESISLDATSGYWEDKTPLNLEAQAVKTVSIPLSEETGGFLLASRETADQSFANPGLTEGERLNADAVESLLRNLGQLRFTNAVDRSHEDVREAWEHRRKFVLEPFEGSPFNLYLGRRPEKVIPSASSEEISTVLENDPETGVPDEPETETIPAGDPYLFLEFAAGDTNPWAEPSRHLAFQVSSFNYEQLETQRDTYVSATQEGAGAPDPDAPSG